MSETTSDVTRASSSCPICEKGSPHSHNAAEQALFYAIEPIAKSLCAAAGFSWEAIPETWPWPVGRRLCQDFFRWQARHAVGLTRFQDWEDEPRRKHLPVHGGAWPLSEFKKLERVKQ